MHYFLLLLFYLWVTNHLKACACGRHQHLQNEVKAFYERRVDIAKKNPMTPAHRLWKKWTILQNNSRMLPFNLSHCCSQKYFITKNLLDWPFFLRCPSQKTKLFHFSWFSLLQKVSPTKKQHTRQSFFYSIVNNKSHTP